MRKRIKWRMLIMKTPYIREIAAVHAIVYYDANNIDKMINEIRIIMMKNVIPTIQEHHATCLWFFNKNDDIIKSLEDQDMLYIDLAIYNDAYKTAYLDFSINTNKDLSKLKTKISELMDELSIDG